MKSRSCSRSRSLLSRGFESHVELFRGGASDYFGAVARARARWASRVKRATLLFPHEIRIPAARSCARDPTRAPVISRNSATASVHSRRQCDRVTSSDASAWHEGVAEGEGRSNDRSWSIALWTSLRSFTSTTTSIPPIPVSQRLVCVTRHYIQIEKKC